jgi:formylglycine-generating enzyme required for sulfatase activity
MSDETVRPSSEATAPQISDTFDPIGALLRARILDPPDRPGIVGRLERFDVLELIGSGGMGVILLAQERGTSRQYALKTLKPALARDPYSVRLFLREGRHMQQMDHPHILRVLEVSDRLAGPYFITPFVQRGSLAQLLRQSEPLDYEVTLSTALQVADALAYAHERGVIHRDLKPANVLVDGEGHAYVADFGLVRDLYGDSTVDAQKAQRVGTGPYMSPGVAAGQAEDTRCDIYSFGALLYEMLTGQPPYDGATTQKVIEKILSGPPPAIRQVNPSAPPALVRVAEGAMARELRDRYASMADVAEDLLKVQAGQAPRGPRGEGWSRRMPLVVGALVFALLVVLGIAMVLWHSGQPAGMGKTGGTMPTVPQPLAEGRVPTTPAGLSSLSVPAGFRAASGTMAEPYTNTGWAKEIVHEATGMELVFIPAGEFLMGSLASEEGRQDDEGPQHRVRITKPFYMGKYEVTQGEWRKVMGSNPSHFTGNDRLPVETVSWNHCQEFLRKAGDGLRLPTEAEWEYACRAGTTTPFHFGNTISTDEANYEGTMTYAGGQKGVFRRKTTPVGSFPPNTWGLYDMDANVRQWCQDWYGGSYYGQSPSADPKGPASGRARVLRGGSWGYGPGGCRSASRNQGRPSDAYDDFGFRVVVVAAHLQPAATITLVGGQLNGQAVSTASPGIVVSPGSSISGSFDVSVDNMGYGIGAIVPVAATPSWGNPSTSYWGIASWAHPGKSTYTVPVNLTAPSQNGTYYVCVAAGGKYDYAQVMSCTHAAIPAVWGDGNDVANWTAAQYEQAMSKGWAVSSELELDSTYQDRPWPATAIRIVVQGQSSTIPRSATSLAMEEMNDRKLLASYAFGGGSNGQTGSGHDRRIGGAEVTDSGLVFDGTKSHVEIPASPAFELTDSMGISACIRRSEIGRMDPIIGKCGDQPGGTSHFEFGIGPDNKLSFAFFVGHWVRHSSQGTISDTNWHTVAVTYDRKEVRFFIDGRLDSALSESARLPANGSPLQIGEKQSSWPFDYFKGTISSLQIFGGGITAAGSDK